MVKEVKEIPFKTKTSRAAALREDINYAVQNKIEQFEFVGEVYETGVDFVQAARTEANDFFTKYLEALAKDRFPNLQRQTANIYISNAYKLYSGRDDKGKPHVYMKIDYDEIDRIIKRMITR